MITQAEVLELLPRWMVADFDCPSGAHEWRDCRVGGEVAFRWCKHCTAHRRVVRQPEPWELYFR